MKVVIVEDEINGYEYLVTILQQIDPTIEVIQHIESVKDAVAYFSKPGGADLIFMDIQLADGISFDIFEHVRIDIPVIFTTAYDEYAIQAFKVNSIDYLLKPIHKNHLEQAISKFKISLEKEQSRMPESFLQQMQEQSRKPKSRCLVKRGNHFEYVNVDNIAFVHSEDSITFLHTSEGKRFIYAKTVEQLIAELPQSEFYQISRSTIVNINSIQEIHPFHNQRVLVKLKNGLEKDIQLIVSRGRVSEFKSWVDQ